MPPETPSATRAIAGQRLLLPVVLPVVHDLPNKSLLDFKSRQARLFLGALGARCTTFEELMRTLAGEDDQLELVLDLYGLCHLVQVLSKSSDDLFRLGPGGSETGSFGQHDCPQTIDTRVELVVDNHVVVFGKRGDLGAGGFEA